VSIQALAPDEILDADVHDAIAQDAVDGLGDSLWLRVIGRKPKEGIAMYRYFRETGWDGNIDHALKEIIRIRLARLAGDTYFSNLRSQAALASGLTEERIEAGCGDIDSDASFSAAERIAIHHADLMFRDKPQVDAAFYDRLKRYYSEPEIMEIGSWAALVWGMAGWFSTMHLYPEHDRDRNAIDQAESARIYGAVPAV
jgi:alkylhydroperoxidase family enzyme